MKLNYIQNIEGFMALYLFVHQVEFFSHVLATPNLFSWIYMKILLSVDSLENLKSQVKYGFTYTFLIEYFQTIILIKAQGTVDIYSKLLSKLTVHYNIDQFHEEMLISFF